MERAAVYPLAEARLVVSKGAAADLSRVSGLSPEHFEVIYNPLPQAEGSGELDDAAAWGGEGARIISIGNLKPEKITSY